VAAEDDAAEPRQLVERQQPELLGVQPLPREVVAASESNAAAGTWARAGRATSSVIATIGASRSRLDMATFP